MIEKYTADISTNLKEIIERNIVFKQKDFYILSSNKSVVGTLSQGDIIRLIYNNIQLNTPVSEIINKKFIYTKKFDKKNIREIFKKHKINSLPLLDNKMRIINIFTPFDYI